MLGVTHVALWWRSAPAVLEHMGNALRLSYRKMLSLWNTFLPRGVLSFDWGNLLCISSGLANSVISESKLCSTFVFFYLREVASRDEEHLLQIACTPTPAGAS